MRNNFSKEATARLKKHELQKFAELRKDTVFGSAYGSAYGVARVLIYILFFVNVLFYCAMVIGMGIEMIDYEKQVHLLFFGFLFSLVLLITGICLFRRKHEIVGAVLLLLSTVIKYFLVYNSETGSPFDFAVEKSYASGFGKPATMFYIHFLPMALLFLMCAYVLVAHIMDAHLFKKQFDEVCRFVYTLKPSDDIGFTSDKEWDICVDRYLSGEYKNFKKPKKSLRHKARKKQK